MILYLIKNLMTGTVVDITGISMGTFSFVPLVILGISLLLAIKYA